MLFFVAEIANCERDIAFFAERHDPDTRQWLFDDFNIWFSDPGDSRAYVLLGDAGVGKSVMAGVLAQRMRKAGHLGAAYFCRHNDGTRNDPRHLLGTIACQLCYCNCKYNNLVGGEDGVRMMLANSKLGVQELFTKLLEEPLGKCTPCQQRKLVIIDALDETEYESREDFLDLVKGRFPRLPKWLVFFITSRPEHTVESRLEKYNPCVRICAGNSEQGTSFYKHHEQDIQRFLEKRVDFSRLPYSVKDITKKCNGLFLYAFYIVKVLNDPAHSGEIDQLSDLCPGDIDDFFRKNFKRLYNKVGKDIFKKLFGCAIAAPSPLPTEIIGYILEREKSSQDEQEVIDVVSQFVVLRSSDRSLTFLHNLIPTWLTNKGKAGKLFIDKTVAGQYLSKIFTEILSVAGNAPLQALTTLEKKLEDYVSRVAVRFLCRHGDKDSLKLVSSCLTSFHFLEQRVQSGRIEIYHLLEDLKLAAGCYRFEDTQRQNILQEISLALESNVHVLLECPHLLHSCLLNCSNAVHENVLIPQVSGPSLEWKVCDFPSAENLLDFNNFCTTSDKKTVAGVKGRSILLVDASTLKIVGGPFEVSEDTIEEITHLEFSPDGKWLFFGRLDRWFSVERGCVEDFVQFSENVVVYEWGLFTPDGQYIVVKGDTVFDFQDKDDCCVTDLLSLWALLEIDQNRDDQMTCSFSGLSKVIAGITMSIRSALGEQTKRLLRFLGVDPEEYETDLSVVPNQELSARGEQTKRLLRSLEVDPEEYETESSVVPTNPTCFYCGRLRELTDSNQESSLSTVRQLVIELYPQIFEHQVWNLQTGRSLLEDVFCRSVQLNPFTYVCHVSCVGIKPREILECSGIDQALSFANIAVLNAVYSLERKVKELRFHRKEPLFHMLSMDTCNSFKLKMYRSLPTGFAVFPTKYTMLGFSSQKKWVVQLRGAKGIHLMQTGVEEPHFSTVKIRTQEHDVLGVDRFTFTNDDSYFVYSTGAVSLYALHLQTGTVFESVSGRNLFYFTKEGQVVYLFRKETEERALFLADFCNPFKFLSSSSVVDTSTVKKSIATIFSSSVTVKSVSSDSLVNLWHITDKGMSFLSNFYFVDSRHLVLQNCVFSPNGKLIACQRGNQIELHSFVPESGHESPIIFQQDNAFTVLFSFSADSSSLLFCIQGNINNLRFYVWDVQNKMMSVPFRSPGLFTVECFCLSADKRKLILCRDYEIEIWEYVQQPRRLLARTGVERSYKSVKFSKCTVSLDNELLICCIANIIILFSMRAPDVHSSKRVLRGHLGKIEFCEILRVNRYLLSYGVDGMVFLWDLIETKAIGFARITQGNESIVSMAVSPEEDRAVCFTSSDRICSIELCKLEGDLSSKFLTIEAKEKVAATGPRLQVAEEIATSKIPIPSTEDDEFSSSDSQEDMYYYYLEHDDVEESD